VRITSVIWLRDVVDKLLAKHNVDLYEVEEVFDNRPNFRFVEKGRRRGDDVYLALGQTDAGRYLTVVFIYKAREAALVLSARDMAKKERQWYGKK